MSRWQPMASMVTTAPSIASISRSAGMAMISLDLSATLTWPSTRRWRAAKADTMWIAAFPPLLWEEPRNVLPSMAITSADTPISLATQATKRRWNSVASSVAKMSPRWSCDGVPSRNGRNRRRSSIFFWPNRAISTNVSAPASTASRHNSSTSSIVNSAMFSPDGQHVVTASADGTARLWNAAADTQMGAPLLGHAGVVSNAAFSPDGRSIVTASGDETARLWDAAGGRQIGLLMGHDGFVSSAAFSHDGKRIVTASSDATARLWDAETGREIRALYAGRPYRVNGAAFSPDDRRVVTASDDPTALL